MPLESATPELADAAKSIGAPFSILLLAALSLNAVVLAYSAYSLYRISRDRSDKQHEQQRKLSEMQVSAQGLPFYNERRRWRESVVTSSVRSHLSPRSKSTMSHVSLAALILLTSLAAFPLLVSLA